MVGLIAKTLPSFELDPPRRYTENKSNKNIDVEGVELAMLILLLKYVLSYSAQTVNKSIRAEIYDNRQQ